MKYVSIIALILSILSLMLFAIDKIKTDDKVEMNEYILELTQEPAWIGSYTIKMQIYALKGNSEIVTIKMEVLEVTPMEAYNWYRIRVLMTEDDYLKFINRQEMIEVKFNG